MTYGWWTISDSWGKYFSNILEYYTSTLGIGRNLIPYSFGWIKKESLSNVAFIHSGNKNNLSKYLSCHAFSKEEGERRRIKKTV